MLSATKGASIAYTTDSADNVAWKLYTGQIKLEKGKTILTRIIHV